MDWSYVVESGYRGRGWGVDYASESIVLGIFDSESGEFLVLREFARMNKNKIIVRKSVTKCNQFTVESIHGIDS
jgi:hypothetical protein